MSTSGNERLWQVLFLLVAALQAIITGFVAWTFNSVQDIRERVVRLETKVDMQNYPRIASTYCAETEDSDRQKKSEHR